MVTIVLATDNCFAQHCAVTMRSILNHNEDVEFYILTEGLNEENVNKLHTVASSCSLNVCKVDSKALKGFPMPDVKTEKISIATYYRLFITQLLPTSVSKVLYLDCDLVVRGSLRELWETDMTGKALAAVYYPDCPTMTKNCMRLGIAPKRPNDQSAKRLTSGYFNAGVLLMNLDYWRSHDLPKRYFDFIAEGKYPLRQRDQDVLNAVTCDETASLPWQYNVMGNELDTIKEIVEGEQLEYVKSLEKVDPVIVHFSFRLKPWEFGCRNPYKKEYRNILKRTPYQGASLQFSWSDFYEFWVKPVIIAPILKLIKR